MALGSDAEVARLAVSLLDLTDLADGTTAATAADLCARARDAGVAAVCVWPEFVTLCADTLEGSGVRVATVVNFPSGDGVDRRRARRHVRVPSSRARTRSMSCCRTARGSAVTRTPAADVLDGVRDLASSGNPTATVKVIIESGELPDRAAIDRAAHFAIAHGADFVKTSTGKTSVSATLDAAETILEAIDVSGQAGRAQGVGRHSHGRRRPGVSRTGGEPDGRGVDHPVDVPVRGQQPARRAPRDHRPACVTGSAWHYLTCRRSSGPAARPFIPYCRA